MNNNTNVANTTGNFFGHPRGLMTLFFTEMWERLSYYGMRGILVLFLVNAVVTGGFGLDDKTATAIYGLYTAGVYLVALPGGWIADRLIGAQRAVFSGGIVIMVGHLLLAVSATPAVFYLGLVTIVIGTGLLKPNISTIVGDLYPEGGGRRDSGFTIYYMGINIGGLLGPLITGYLATTYGWGPAFLSAAIGMALGLVQFQATRRFLNGAGSQISTSTGLDSSISRNRNYWIALIACVALLLAVIAAIYSGVVQFSPLAVAQTTAWFIIAFAVAYFAYLLFFARLTTIEVKRVVVLVAFFIASTIFWAVYEQAGSSLNLFAERFTDRVIHSINFEIPTSWFQSFDSAFIVFGGSILFSALWATLAKREKDPSAPAKLALGLIIVGSAFLFMVLAADIVAKGHKVAPMYLIATYVLHTIGELCLSPIAMSSFTKLAPRRFVGQIMGVFFLSMSLGNLLAGLIAGLFDPEKIAAMPGQYLDLVWLAAIPGVLLLVLVKPLNKLAGGIR